MGSKDRRSGMGHGVRRFAKGRHANNPCDTRRKETFRPLEATDPGATEPSGQLPIRNPRLAWSMQLDYKGANPANQGSWGAYAAYRRLGLWATWIPTYEINGAVEQNNRGWDFGVSYVPLKNVSLSAKYFRGSGIDEYEKINALFGEIEMFF